MTCLPSVRETSKREKSPYSRLRVQPQGLPRRAVGAHVDEFLDVFSAATVNGLLVNLVVIVAIEIGTVGTSPSVALVQLGIPEASRGGLLRRNTVALFICHCDHGKDGDRDGEGHGRDGRESRHVGECEVNRAHQRLKSERVKYLGSKE